MDSNLHHSINCYSPYMALGVLSRVGNEAKSEVYEVGAAVCLDMALRPCHDYVWWANFSCTLERDFFSCGNSFNLLAHVEKIRVSVARLSIGAFQPWHHAHLKSTREKKRNFLPKFWSSMSIWYRKRIRINKKSTWMGFLRCRSSNRQELEQEGPNRQKSEDQGGTGRTRTKDRRLS